MRRWPILLRLLLRSTTSSVIVVMGNLCGTPSKDDDNFSAPGRPVNSAAPPKAKPAAAAPIPKPAQAQIANRTLGGTNSSADGPRAAAARAAEVCSQTFSRDARLQCDNEHITDKADTRYRSELRSSKLRRKAPLVRSWTLRNDRHKPARWRLQVKRTG